MSTSENYLEYSSQPQFLLKPYFGGDRVVYLNKLTGSVPPSLGNLVNLTTLLLYNNSLTGPIPSSLGNISGLTYLDLSYNSLTGSIPSSLGNISGLTYLDLSYNSLTGSIPSSLGNLVGLTTLHLWNNSLTGPLPSTLGNLSGLTVLDLDSNILTGSIPSSLGNLVDLTFLSLFSNSISGPIPASILSLINLRTIYLSHNALTGPIPVSMSEALTGLELLYMDSNNLSGPISEHFGRFMPNLTFFVINNNSFNGTLPDGLCHGGQLTEIAAFNNNLEGPIPPSLGSCSSLKRTRLSYNQFTSIPTGFGRNFALVYLDVSYNQLALPLPAGLGANSSLAFLDLSANVLTGDMSILEFAQLGNLSSLHLASNNLSGEIPAAMGLCNLLFAVDLSYNSLTGAVPLALANLSAIRELNLQGNNLTALNTGVYAGWDSTLQTLNLAENPWNASIEPEIGSLRLLQSLTLSYGGRTGPIPPVLGELTQLEVLDLSHNHLTGPVPSALGGMVSLISVDVSFNGLTGSLPPQWVKFLIADPASFRGNPGLCMQYDTDNVCMEGLGAGGGWRLKLSERVWVGVGVGVGVVGVASWTLAVLAALRFRRRKKPQVEPNIMAEEKITTQNLTKEPLPLTFEQILSATENMSGTQIIGKGGHGVVFRVKCPSDYHRPFIAVKKIQFEDVKPTMLHKSFWSEVDTVGQARHRNLVRLLGFVKRDRVGLLVYDYVSNGDLFSALHDRNGSLPWRARFGIARDVARGLAYLHHDYDAPIVHRDIKSSNVLLDDHLEAYISDFGVAKVLDTLSGPKSDQVSATMSVVGTCGYIAPGECALSAIACPCSS